MDAPPERHPPLRLVERQRDGARERAAFALAVHPGSLYLQGHFPGFPIFPGVALLLAVVLPGLRRLWPELPAPRRLGRVKFRSPVLPGDALTLHLERDGDAVRFRLERDERGDRGDARCAEGTLEFPASPA